LEVLEKLAFAFVAENNAEAEGERHKHCTEEQEELGERSEDVLDDHCVALRGRSRNQAEEFSGYDEGEYSREQACWNSEEIAQLECYQPQHDTSQKYHETFNPIRRFPEISPQTFLLEEAELKSFPTNHENQSKTAAENPKPLRA
jgi:hypothetical protein